MDKIKTIDDFKNMITNNTEKKYNNKNNTNINTENNVLKKQKREIFPEKNVVYMITTEDNKNNRIYIIGKTINLQNRLSTYNKTSEHEVIYYQGFENEGFMNMIENMVLNKLNIYRQRSNRDRFILPIDEDITFFINIIKQCIAFFD